MIFQVLIHVKCIDFFGVKSRQKHIHYQQYIYTVADVFRWALPIFQFFGYVIVIVIEIFTCFGRILSIVQLIVIFYVLIQFLPAVFIDGIDSCLLYTSDAADEL